MYYLEKYASISGVLENYDSKITDQKLDHMSGSK